MEYTIGKIEPKSEYIVNKYYPAMIGRECDVVWLMRGTSARLVIDMAYDPGNPHRFVTTAVEDIRHLEDGALIFVTENSTYTLFPTKKGG